MAIPPNTTRETAAEIVTLPASITLDVTDAPNDNLVWYKYTAAGSVIHLSVYAWADSALDPYYRPFETIVYEGDSETPYLSFNTSRAGLCSFLIPLTTGTTYYLAIWDTGVTPPVSAILHLSVQATPNEVVPAGSILVNDDTAGYDRAAMLSATDGTFLKSVDFPPGEYADIMPDGTILAENLAETTLDLFAPDLSLLTQIAWPYAASGFHPRIRAAGDHFYVIGCWPQSDTGTRVLRAVSTTGMVEAQTWTIPSHLDYYDEVELDVGIRIFAVSQDETTLYYDHYRYDTALYHVASYDLVNDIPITDSLFTLPAGSQPAVGNGYHQTEAYTLADGSIIIATEVPRAILKYNAAGTLLLTIPMSFPEGSINRISRGVDDTTVWVWSWAESPYAESRFWEFDLASGALLTHFHVPLFFSGVSGALNGTLVTQPRFGISSSCPFVIWRSLPVTESMSPSSSGSASYSPSRSSSWSVSPSIGPEEVRLIRRLRQSPHLSDEQMGFFIAQFQLDLETGLGLPNSEGTDPQIMLCYSDDGGHTWSDEQWVSAGEKGAYAWRAIWRRLGRSRDRVWRVVVSDPVPWRLLDAYVLAEKGLH